MIAGAPFFVHGLIRNGLGRSYPAFVDPGRVLVIFVNRADSLAAALGVNIDSQGTWLLISPTGQVLWTLKDTGPTTVASLVQRLGD